MMVKISGIKSIFCSHCSNRGQIVSNNLGGDMVAIQILKKKPKCVINLK